MLEKTMRARRFLSAVATAIVAAVLPAAASAGTFDVTACGAAPGNVNHSWTATNTSPATLQTTSVCPPSGPYGGLAATDVLQSAGAPDGASALWTFTAPPGTTITRFRYDRFVGKSGDDDWIVGGELSNGERFDNCTFAFGSDECTVGASGAGNGGGRDLSGLSTDSISFGVACRATGTGVTTCIDGYSLHDVWAALYSATVTLLDPSAPTLTGATGVLAGSSGYRRGMQSATLDAADNSGIAETSVYVDGVQYEPTSRSCDFTYVRPCSDLSNAAVSLNTATIPDGSHSVQLAARDAAGNEARTAPTTMLFDNTAPPAPTGLAVVGGPRHTSNDFDVDWTNPSGQVAPLTTVHYELCSGTCEPQQTAPLTTSLKGLTLPAPGTWTLRVWLEDAAGNVDASNAATSTLTYQQPAAGGGSGGGGGGGTGAGTGQPIVVTPSAPPAPAPAPLATPPVTEPSPVAPAPRRRHSVRLRIRSAVRHGHTVRVAGTAIRAASGRLTVTYAQRVHDHIRRQRVTTRLRRGRFHLTIRLRGRVANGGKGIVTVVFPGDRGTRRAMARMRVAVTAAR